MEQPELIYHEIKPDESEFQDALLGLFRATFPKYSRYVPHIKKSMRVGMALNPRLIPHHWLIMQANQPVAFTLFNYLIESNIGFGRYIGVDPDYRSAGIGFEIIQHTKKQICVDSQNHANPEPIGFCAEVESPALATTEQDREINQRRIDYFIHKCGALDLAVDYLEPVMIQDESAEDVRLPAEPTPMHLILHPVSDDTHQVSPKVTREIVSGVLFDHYRLDPEDRIVATILSSIPPAEV